LCLRVALSPGPRQAAPPPLLHPCRAWAQDWEGPVSRNLPSVPEKGWEPCEIAPVLRGPEPRLFPLLCCPPDLVAPAPLELCLPTFMRALPDFAIQA
jgi:hypothetical protein